MTLEVRYFAWLRERVGQSVEHVETEAATVQDLVEELRAKDDGHAAAFADMKAVRVALDQELGEFTDKLVGVREVAFFPPMTGG